MTTQITDDPNGNPYGYEIAAPTPSNEKVLVQPRRSCFRGDGVPRRASISYTGEMQLTLPTGEVKTRRTSITFQDNPQVKDVTPVWGMVEDPSDLWFNSLEYAHIQDKIQEIVEKISRDGKIADNQTSWLCTRGLEGKLGGGCTFDKHEAYHSVIEEQNMQKVRGKYDVDFIRSIYEFHTLDSRLIAAARAEKDAKEVEQYTKDTRRMMRRLTC